MAKDLVILTVRATQDEKREFFARADTLGLPLADYIRRAIRAEIERKTLGEGPGYGEAKKTVPLQE